VIVSGSPLPAPEPNATVVEKGRGSQRAVVTVAARYRATLLRVRFCLPIEQARPVSRAHAHVGRAWLVSQNRVQRVQRLEYSLVPATPFDQLVQGHVSVVVLVDQMKNSVNMVFCRLIVCLRISVSS